MNIIVTDISFLKKKCERVEESEIPFLKERLISSFEEHNRTNPDNPGVGLAAPQIGISKKACYIRSNSIEIFLFNPEIIDSYGFDQIKEGCLSIPDRKINVSRNKHVVIVSDNYPNGIILSGMNAIIAQHEIDHLNGVLITDHLQTRVSKHKMNRNDPCHCGSGKKFKRCCIK